MPTAAWLPTDITPEEALRVIPDPEWYAQEKFDGIHVICERTMDAEVRIYNRDGNASSKAPVTLYRTLESLPRGTVITGELLHGGPFMVFDALCVGGVSMLDARYKIRLGTVERILEAAFPDSHEVRLVQTARTAHEKLAMLERLESEYAEGMILKWSEALYIPGRPIVGGSMRRLKFRKSAEVILQRRPDPDDVHSFEMWVAVNAGQWINVGSVNANTLDVDNKPFYDKIPPGGHAVAECSYLYATKGRKLYQPVIVRFRDDKTPDECTLDQLVLSKRWR